MLRELWNEGVAAGALAFCSEYYVVLISVVIFFFYFMLERTATTATTDDVLQVFFIGEPLVGSRLAGLGWMSTIQC